MIDYITRSIEPVCFRDLKTFPVLTLTGPRQSGKSTLLRKLLPDWDYVNLEDGTYLDFALNDPKGLIQQHADRVIIDEIQRAPKLLSQIQVQVDRDRRPGRFALSGSQNLLLLESVSQSLAGRTAVRYLLPFAYFELDKAGRGPAALEPSLYLGGYPPVHQAPEAAQAWLDSYLQTYVERDVRMLRNVSRLAHFRNFLRLCAGRVGQLIDFTSLGNDLGASHNTMRDWVGLLEASFVAFRLEPYFQNFSKRLIKSPKLYFYDTGLLCRLLNIRNAAEIANHPFKGAIFENWCVTETVKSLLNRGESHGVYFWRDRTIEVDLIVSKSATTLSAIEIKAGATPHAEFIEAAEKLRALAKGNMTIEPAVVYGGNETQRRGRGTYFSWRDYAIEVAQF